MKTAASPPKANAPAIPKLAAPLARSNLCIPQYRSASCSVRTSNGCHTLPNILPTLSPPAQQTNKDETKKNNNATITDTTNTAATPQPDQTPEPTTRNRRDDNNTTNTTNDTRIIATSTPPEANHNEMSTNLDSSPRPAETHHKIETLRARCIRAHTKFRDLMAVAQRPSSPCATKTTTELEQKQNTTTLASTLNTQRTNNPATSPNDNHKTNHRAPLDYRNSPTHPHVIPDNHHRREDNADVDTEDDIDNNKTKEHNPQAPTTRIETSKQNDDNQLLAGSRSSRFGANSGWDQTMDRRISQQPQPKITSTRPTAGPTPHLRVELLHDYPTHSARPPGGERQCQSLPP